MASSKATRYFPCPVERVWRTVTDLSHTAWRRGLARVEVLDKAHFVEHTKSGYATYFTVTACQPPRFWAFTMENSSMAGRWEGRFQAADGGTWLTRDNIIALQAEAALNAGYQGVILYSSEYLDAAQAAKELENAMAVLG